VSAEVKPRSNSRARTKFLVPTVSAGRATEEVLENLPRARCRAAPGRAALPGQPVIVSRSARRARMVAAGLILTGMLTARRRRA
jgi:hypothetical protein